MSISLSTTVTFYGCFNQKSDCISGLDGKNKQKHTRKHHHQQQQNK